MNVLELSSKTFWKGILAQIIRQKGRLTRLATPRT